MDRKKRDVVLFWNTTLHGDVDTCVIAQKGTKCRHWKPSGRTGLELFVLSSFVFPHVPFPEAHT